MTLYVTLSAAQADTGPFNLFSNVDGYLSAIAVNVPKATLLAGLSLPSAPNGTTAVKIKSVGVCTNELNLIVGVSPGTTTTSSSTTSTSTTLTTTTTSLPLALPVISDCCSLGTTHYIAISELFTTGSVIASASEGFLRGYTVTGLPVPGVVDLVVYDNTDYGSCANFLSFWGGLACNPI